MKRALALIAAIATLSIALSAMQAPATQPPTGAARITGKVVDADSGEPLVFATALLTSTLGGPGKRASTDKEGKYSFADLSQGAYRVTFTAEGYVGLDYGQKMPPAPGTAISVKSGETVTANIALPRTSAIEGQLLDEFGEPAPGVSVQIANVMFAAGRSRLMPISNRYPVRPTNDQGRYRIFGVAPGDYFVLALSGSFASESFAGGPSASGSDRAGFAPTFYPGTAVAPEAKAVHLDAGKDATNVNFALVAANAAQLSGKALDVEGRPQTSVQLMLMQLYADDVRAIIPARAVVGSDGSFSFRNVPYGDYVIQGFGSTGFGALKIKANQPRMADLSLTVRPFTTGTGRIIFDGDAALPVPSRVRPETQPIDFVTGPVGGGPSPSKVNDDWTFEVSRQTGLRVLTMSVPAPWRLKRIMLKGVDVTDMALDFREHDIDGLEVTMSSRVSTVSGNVTDDTGQPVVGARVIIFAEDTKRWTWPSRYWSTMPSEAQGAFKLSGLPAETYLAVAINEVANFEWSNPALLESLRGRAVRFVLGDQETRTLNLKLIKQ